MAQQWFYEKNGNQYGPLNSHQMQALGKSGELGPSDLVWREGMQTKIPAAKYKGLLPERAVTQSNLPDDSKEVVIDSSPPGREKTNRSRQSSLLSGRAMFSLSLEAQSFVYSNWATVVFLTVVFVLACACALALILTLPLAPVFMMGYMSNISRIHQRQRIHWEDFILFLRRGWSSLFNVFELCAVFILITAVVILFLYLCGLFCFFILPLGQIFEPGILRFSFLSAIILPVYLLGLALSFGAATSYWVVVYAARDDVAGSNATDDVSIYSRLQLGLQSLGNNKSAIFSAGACIALYTLAYGVVFLVVVLLLAHIGRELPYGEAGYFLRQILGLLVTAVSILWCCTGLSSLLVYYVFVADRVVGRSRNYS